MSTNKANCIFDDDKNTLLHFAAARGLEEEVKNHIDSGHKIDVENYLGWTPLMMATRNGHKKIVDVLLENGADATRKNKFGGSLFLMAAASGNLEILQKMLEHLLCGGVSKQSMESLVSPISIAILFNQEHVFKFLLGKQFSENAVSPVTGLTPLMFASVSENLSYSAILLSRGANQHAKSINNESYQDMLRRKRGTVYQEIPSPCLQHDGNMPQVIIYSPQPQFLNVAPRAQVHRKSSNTITPNYCYTPNVTPIFSTGFYPQVFFPTDFSPNHIISPVVPFNNMDPFSYCFSQGTIMSPMPQLNVNFRVPHNTPY